MSTLLACATQIRVPKQIAKRAHRSPRAGRCLIFNVVALIDLQLPMNVSAGTWWPCVNWCCQYAVLH
jgi:hypothetical protein